MRVFWERYGDGEPTLLFLPTWSIVHSRVWKAQIPYFARHFRVVTFDGARQRPLRPPIGARGVRDRRVRGGRAGRHGRHRNGAGVARVAVDGRSAGAAARRRPPGTRSRPGVHRVRRCRYRHPPRELVRPGRSSQCATRRPTTGAGRSSTSTTGSTITTISSSSSPPTSSASRTRPSRSRTASRGG